MNWLIWVLIGITVFEFWRNFHEDKKSGVSFSWSDLSPSNLLDEDMGCLIVLVFAGLVLLFNESREARLLLVFGIAIYCGFRYFKREHEEIQKREKGFFAKLVEYVCLLLMVAFIGLMVLSMGAKDMMQHSAQQQIQNTLATTHQHQR